MFLVENDIIQFMSKMIGIELSHQHEDRFVKMIKDLYTTGFKLCTEIETTALEPALFFHPKKGE
jgi:hypothetical protein